MAPNSEQMDSSLDTLTEDECVPRAPQATPRKFTIVYYTVVLLLYYHISSIYALYLCCTSVKLSTIFFNIVLHVVAVAGVTVGAHRLWSHRAFKAKLPLQIILMLFNSMASQNTVCYWARDHSSSVGRDGRVHWIWSHRAFKAKRLLQIIFLMLFNNIASQNTVCYWARDHRLHHKYNDTDADPYNSARGVFYSHVGWLMVKKHPDVLKRSKDVDMSDLYGNPVLQFQNKYYFILTIVLGFILPTLIPMYYWQETVSNAYHVSLLRFVIGLHAIFFVNSLAHSYGNKPYDKHISATQSVTCSVLNLGECYHNFHHVFPFDYRASELGNNFINFGTNFIDFFARIGWAYDLRTASEDMIVNRAKRTGDGTDHWGRMKKDYREVSKNCNRLDTVSEENLLSNLKNKNMDAGNDNMC